MTADGAARSVRLWEDGDGSWHWDVRVPGLRSTGERVTWPEAFGAAWAEMAHVQPRGGEPWPSRAQSTGT